MVGQLGAVSGEQLFLQLFCKVGLEDAHQLFLGDGSCPQHFQKLLSFPENRKYHVDHFGCFPSQPTPRFSDYLSEYCHRVPNWSVPWLLSWPYNYHWILCSLCRHGDGERVSKCGIKSVLNTHQLTVPSMSGQVLAYSPRHGHMSTYSCAAHQFWRQWRRAGCEGNCWH